MNIPSDQTQHINNLEVGILMKTQNDFCFTVKQHSMVGVFNAMPLNFMLILAFIHFNESNQMNLKCNMDCIFFSQIECPL